MFLHDFFVVNGTLFQWFGIKPGLIPVRKRVSLAYHGQINSIRAMTDADCRRLILYSGRDSKAGHHTGI
ncbi:hypothetical protein DU198_26105, partial [Salmonella enterica subsp. enterica serovar Eastbourne]|nr:hypothetical protein [Salmonella enterica subsp. enterica serovar Eastbourne]